MKPEAFFALQMPGRYDTVFGKALNRSADRNVEKGGRQAGWFGIAFAPVAQHSDRSVMWPALCGVSRQDRFVA
ncbi:hypothetical protein XI05_08685 [Bradyrhizobium sp. CCBAU 11357]|nr:hypothetical protein [Bradyrhizobium sp. CCBAU 11357]